MYFSLSRNRDATKRFLDCLSRASVESLSSVDILITPDFVALTGTIEQLKSSNVPVWPGAQDCHWEDDGAFTGEVSPAVLSETGVKIVGVGHAERRRPSATMTRRLPRRRPL
ncbi:mitochondrial triosephosphate isomerase [Metarhizium album ARSEF 1941]|uniref:Triosephosphate isomerase n=1 Tax=Metarhizium album (strain ARSEF 1941) TaxID=1081103 RepID=A0A0B2WNJ2_METAS|nr:mitochondrial triosephosphate isomerase [Metarhizium album ARSEF 1941]KHN95057.1 mitochondrial triosephosphate isomerase [Metarhizium album ARSEF 1941]